jgi:hypothetical protein
VNWYSAATTSVASGDVPSIVMAELASPDAR